MLLDTVDLKKKYIDHYELNINPKSVFAISCNDIVACSRYTMVLFQELSFNTGFDKQIKKDL